MFTAHRADDAVITVCQNNKKRTIEVKELNEEAGILLGVQDIQGRELTDFLPPRLVELINEYVEFSEYGSDLADVLSKVHGLSLADSKGRERSFKLKVIRSETPDRHSWFKILLHDERSIRGVQAFQDILQENFKGHEVLDSETDLPNQYSVEKDLELVRYHAGSKNMEACFALVRVDEYDRIMAKYGRVACVRLMKEIAAVCKQNLRAEDTLGAVGEGTLGIILVNINIEAARVVLNRLRWLIASSKFDIRPAGVPITVSISFIQVQGDADEKTLIPTLRERLQSPDAVEGNTIVEVAA